MGFKTFQQNFPPLTKFVDSTGFLTKDGKYFLLNGLNRTGGQNGQPSVTATQAAGGTTGASAPELSNDVNHVTSVPSGSGTKIPPMQVGANITVSNGGSNVMLVYPPAGFQIDNGGMNAPFNLNPGAVRTWQAISTSKLITVSTNGVP